MILILRTCFWPCLRCLCGIYSIIITAFYYIKRISVIPNVQYEIEDVLFLLSVVMSTMIGAPRNDYPEQNGQKVLLNG